MVRTEPDPPETHSGPPFHLVTLGKAELLRADGCTAIGPSKPLALLAYLQCSPGRTATREHLCALLWGDSTPRHAAGALRTTLHRTHALLGEHAAEGGATTITLRLDIQADRDGFLGALANGDLDGAVRQYAGAFFPDYGDPGTAGFEQWTDRERARLQELFLRASETLARRALDSGHFCEAVRIARLIRRHAPDAETGWRLLFESLLLSRDDLAARAEAESFGAWVRGEGREPEAATKVLIARIRGGGAAPSDQPSNAGFIAELIGREQQFSLILRAWESVRRGDSQHLHVSAPPGIGKTRLLTDVAGRLAASGGRVVSVRANVGERALDYAFAGELARGLGALPGAVGVPPRTASVLVGLQPALATVFASAPPITTEDLLLQRAQAVAELLAAVADNGPVALLVDDTHWIDGASRHILRALAGRLERSPVLLLTAGRPPETALPSDVPTETIALEPLSPADVEAFIGSLGSLPDAEWKQPLVAAVHRATRGSPLLLLETLQLARERGELTLSEGAWACAVPDAFIGRLGMHDALAERLGALKEDASGLMRFLAVSGTPLSGVELATLSGTTLPAVDALMLTLERRGLAFLIGLRWELAHDEIAGTLLGLLNSDRRAEAHRALGHLFAADRTRGEGAIPRAVHHLAAAGADAEIVPLFRRWVVAARQSGERARPARLAEELLGEYATRERVRSLEAALPFRIRRGIKLSHIAAVTGALLIAGVLIARSRVAATRNPPDEELLIASGKWGDSAFTLHRLPVREDAWPTADSIRLREGSRAGTWQGVEGIMDLPAISPDGKRIAYSRIVRDSGVIDLFLREADGSVRRLTEAVGDDLDPSWSPDGQFLAFRTARWTPRGDDDADIAVLEVATGAVRQLTSGSATDRLPQWSPDGSRIAFVRQEVAEVGPRFCWVTADGQRQRCPRGVGGGTLSLSGWLDPDRIGVATSPDEGTAHLGVLTLSTETLQIVDTTQIVRANVSRDGRWAVTAFGAPGIVTVFPIDAPYRRRFLSTQLAGDWSHILWMPPRAPVEYRWRLRAFGTAIVGVSHQLRVELSDAQGKPVRTPPDVPRWRSGDERAGLVDSVTGVLRPLRPGTLWVYVSAGGWWRDSVWLTVPEPSVHPVFEERWRDSTLSGWRLFGDPKPRVVSGPGGIAAFHNNGDNTFLSGGVTAREFLADSGLGVEALISTPVSRPKWQQLRFGLLTDVEVLEDGASGAGCVFSLPPSEGVGQMSQFTVSSVNGGASLVATPELRSGRWHRLRIQIFPDGTCGVALDGKPLWRSTSGGQAGKSYSVALSGHSVGTKILVGPLEVWQGVKTDVDWWAVPPAAGRDSLKRSAADPPQLHVPIGTGGHRKQAPTPHT